MTNVSIFTFWCMKGQSSATRTINIIICRAWASILHWLMPANPHPLYSLFLFFFHEDYIPRLELLSSTGKRTCKIFSFFLSFFLAVSIRTLKRQRKATYPTRIPGIIVKKHCQRILTIKSFQTEQDKIKTKVAKSQIMPYPSTPEIHNKNKEIMLREAGRLG